MNGWLVIARAGSDDVPLRLCEARAEAEEFAAGVKDAYVQLASEQVYGTYTEDLLAVDLVEFREGVPQRVVMFKDLDS